MMLAASCVPSKPEAGHSMDGEDWGIASEALGGDLASCVVAGSSGYGAGQVLTLTLTGGPSTILVSAAPPGKITVNGTVCVNASGAELTTSGAASTAVKKLVIVGDPAVAEKVILDFYQASFGTTLLSGGAGTGIVIDLGTGPGITDTFLLRGTSYADKVILGRSASGEVYADINGDKRAEVKLVNVEAFMVTLLDGNDTFTATGGLISAPAFTTGSLSLSPVLQAVNVYGGDGNDTLQGGSGDDTLYGGDGDDWFLTSTGAIADGADVYYGGPGTDTIEYSGRTSSLTVSIGPSRASRTGTVDLTTLMYPTALSGETLTLVVDGIPVNITFSAPADMNAVVGQINAAAGDSIAALDSAHRLVLSGLQSGPAGTLQVVAGTALTNLGLSAALTTAADADDGQSGEHDDVTYTVENIVGGSNDDVLMGSDQVNVLTGGAGHDTLVGGANALCSGTGDLLSGGMGDDTFLMGATANCGVVVKGGAGIDRVDYSQRTANLVVTLDGVADDGEPAGAGERGNLSASDVEVVLGGNGDDILTGSLHDDELHGGLGDDTLNGSGGNDVLVGGPGNDMLNGGAGDELVVESGLDGAYTPAVAAGSGNDRINGGTGFDQVDYSARTASLVITLCVDAATAGPPTASPLPTECSDQDGDPLLGEADNVVNVEWLASGSGDDVLTGGSSGEIMEGSAGHDVIHGGAGNDVLYGDEGNDVLYGDGGHDYVEGGAGSDTLNGGAGDGDICVSDGADSGSLMACEL